MDVSQVPVRELPEVQPGKGGDLRSDPVSPSSWSLGLRPGEKATLSAPQSFWGHKNRNSLFVFGLCRMAMNFWSCLRRRYSKTRFWPIVLSFAMWTSQIISFFFCCQNKVRKLGGKQKINPLVLSAALRRWHILKVTNQGIQHSQMLWDNKAACKEITNKTSLCSASE